MVRFADAHGLEGSVDTRACFLQPWPDCPPQGRYLPKPQSSLDSLGGSLLTLSSTQAVSLVWCPGVLEFWVPLFVWLEECGLQSMCVGGISQLIISNKSPFPIIFSLFSASPHILGDLKSPATDRTYAPCSGSRVLTTGPPGNSLNSFVFL